MRMLCWCRYDTVSSCLLHICKVINAFSGCCNRTDMMAVRPAIITQRLVYSPLCFERIDFSQSAWCLPRRTSLTTRFFYVWKVLYRWFDGFVYMILVNFTLSFSCICFSGCRGGRSLSSRIFECSISGLRLKGRTSTRGTSKEDTVLALAKEFMA